MGNHGGDGGGEVFEWRGVMRWKVHGFCAQYIKATVIIVCILYNIMCTLVSYV